MNAESSPGTKKRSPISPLFLVGAIGVLAVGYFAGPSIMTYVMYLQEESAKSNTPIANEKIAPRPEGLSFGGTTPGASSPGGENRGNPPADPEARFAELDQDSDGILAGEELSERMSQRLDEIDTDGDGSISKAEFMARFQSQPGASSDEDSPPSEPQLP
jgi:hypothetical protein